MGLYDQIRRGYQSLLDEWVMTVFVNGKDTMSVDNVYQLEGHGGGTLHGIKIPAGRAEAAVATKRDKFPFAAFWAVEHSTAKGGIATA